MPALLLYNEEPPVDKVSSQQYLEIVRILQQYKLVFAKQQIWEILSKKLSDLLKMVRIELYFFFIIDIC